jgi:CRISPR/Cas system CMR subunit Cmr4 (Cas7 group RAMP superfamily)
MRFEITFHTPFRVGSGQAGDGSDTTVDRKALLPASSLKGVIKSAARDLLKFPDDLVEGIFGTAWRPSPWAWSDARVLDAGGSYPAIRPRARIQIEPGSMTVTRGALLVADEVLAARAEFSINQTGWIKPGDVSAHETVLLAAARSVTAIGSDRRRGLGWVTVTPVDPSWSDAHLRAALRLAQAANAPAWDQANVSGASHD